MIMKDEILFEEKQNGLALFLGIALVLSITISIIVAYMIISAGENIIPALIPMVIAIIVLLPCLFIFGKMTIRLGSNTLRFGFAPFNVKIPVDQISRIALTRAGFGKTWGLGIRLSLNGRFYYNTFWGSVIEVDFPGKRYGFSIKDEQGFLKAFNTVRPDLGIEA
jgi:hypothetical protein